MKRSIGCLSLSLSLAALLGSSYAHAQDLANYDAYFDATAAPAVAPAAKVPASSALGFASSFDTRRGVPSFIWAASQRPLPPPGIAHTSQAAALWYLRDSARAWDLSADAFDATDVVKVHDIGHGPIVVTLRQQVDGFEVFHGEIKVLMKRNLQLVAISGSPRRIASAETKLSGRTFKIAPDQAIGKAFANLYGITLKPSDLRDTKNDKAGYKLFDLAPKTVGNDRLFIYPARVKKVFYQLPDRLVPAYFLEIFSGKIDETDSDSFAYVIAADNGRVLFRQNLTESEVFNYRVWTEPDFVPRDGPQANFTPHPTGIPDGTTPPFIPSNMVAMEGFNHNPSSVADPWLPPAATEMLGNNIDAYSDDDTPDGFSPGDFRTTTTTANTFDRVYDIAAEPQVSQAQTMAAMTQLFYDTNWLHDWYYDSGFNEAAGNAQTNNFGRGGVEGDVLNAQAQDAPFLQRNNANMSTPADGMHPKMQMYLWAGKTLSSSLIIQPSNLSLNVGTASFGPRNFAHSNGMALGQDAVAPIGNACEPIVTNVTNKIALVDRGVCTFIIKAQNVQAAGATGLIIANNSGAAAPPSLGGFSPTVTIPTLSVTQADGNALKAALLSGPQTASMARTSDVERDGDIDNNIVGHEWGHYLHHRLETCGLQQCRGMSEGWGDFTALQMSMRDGDNLDGTYAMAGYSTITFADSGYFGIRRAPYSTDFNKNAFTFKHVADGEALPTTPLATGGAVNSEVHNVGEIWASMMFESYVSLLKAAQGPTPRYTYQEARRLMSDYVVAGMQFTQNEPTVTQQRDAILAVVYANEPLDMALFADAFSKRGAGTCAVSPPVESVDLTEVVESFGVQSNFAFLDMDFDDSIASCDSDGILDGEERGQVTIRIMNSGIATLTNTQATLTSLFPGVIFPNGPNVSFGSVAPYAIATATVDIALDPSVAQIGYLALNLDVTDPAACNPITSASIVRRVNYDNVANVAAFDTVESNLLSWTATQANGNDIWTRDQVAPENHEWHGIDFSTTSDTSLESPDLVVSATDPFIFTMEHHFWFEASGGVQYDGAVLELTEDGGATWNDISTYVDPGYNGVVTEPTNALAGRDAFVFQSPSYPDTQVLSLNFGTALAGKTVKIRYRIATDGGVGTPGWEIDNISFLGITNTPFSGIVTDGATCDGMPVANAGPDQTVQGGNEVSLNASGSSDPDGDPITYQWTQVAGPAVSLTSTTTTAPMFTAPSLGADTTLTFQVHVSDGSGSSTDAVDITVESNGQGGAGGGGGQGGAGGGQGGMGEGGAGAQGGEGPGTTTSSSSNGSGGTGGRTLPTPEDDGCSCSTVGSTSSGTNPVAALLAAAALFIQRRRRTAKRS